MGAGVVGMSVDALTDTYSNYSTTDGTPGETVLTTTETTISDKSEVYLSRVEVSHTSGADVLDSIEVGVRIYKKTNLGFRSPAIASIETNGGLTDALYADGEVGAYAQGVSVVMEVYADRKDDNGSQEGSFDELEAKLYYRKVVEA